MQQVRIRRKVRGRREIRLDVLPLDPRDPDVVRAKVLKRDNAGDRRPPAW